MLANRSAHSSIEVSKKLLEVLPPIVQRIRSQARRVVKGQLTMPQFRILSNIKNGIVTVGEIADNHVVSQPTMSKMVDGLVKRGLLKRVTHAKDRRQVILHLTTRGERLQQKAFSNLQTSLSNDFDNLTGDERRWIYEALEQLEGILLKTGLEKDVGIDRK